MSGIVRGFIASQLRNRPRAQENLLKIYDSRVLHFLTVGGLAACLHVLCAWAFTTFVFGVSRYYIGYFIGMGMSWTFNFVMHMYLTFGVADRFAARLVGFLVHSVVSNFLQAWLVTRLTSVFGREHYLFIITMVIMAISMMTFYIFKMWLFAANGNNQMSSTDRA